MFTLETEANAIIGAHTYNTYQYSVWETIFSNARQNGEWTETSTLQNEIELAMFGE